MEVTRFLPLLGRLLIGLPFLMSGFGKLTTYGATTAYIGSVGLPLAPLGWAIAVAFEIGGGLLLVRSVFVRERLRSAWPCSRWQRPSSFTGISPIRIR